MARFIKNAKCCRVYTVLGISLSSSTLFGGKAIILSLKMVDITLIPSVLFVNLPTTSCHRGYKQP